MPAADDEEVTNFYEKLPKKFKAEERHYENESKVNIPIPFRMCITGASGSGKTNALRYLITKMACFDRFYLLTKVVDESLYAELVEELREAEKKTGEAILTVSDNLKDLPPVDSIKTGSEHNTLLIIDDMVGEKDKALVGVKDYWTRGRKKYVSCCYLSQAYFQIPLIVRQNTDFFIFTRIATDRDLTFILKDHQLGIGEDEILKLYHKATEGGFPNFFMIDKLAKGDRAQFRFRRNFKPLEAPPSSEEKDEKGDKVEKKEKGAPAPKSSAGSRSSAPSKRPKGAYSELQEKKQEELEQREKQRLRDEAKEEKERDREFKENMMDLKKTRLSIKQREAAEERLEKKKDIEIAAAQKRMEAANREAEKERKRIQHDMEKRAEQESKARHKRHEEIERGDVEMKDLPHEVEDEDPRELRAKNKVEHWYSSKTGYDVDLRDLPKWRQEKIVGEYVRDHAMLDPELLDVMDYEEGSGVGRRKRRRLSSGRASRAQRPKINIDHELQRLIAMVR